MIKQEEIKDIYKIEDKQKITLVLDRKHTYYANINFLYYHINFFYDLSWEKSGKNADATEIPKINFKISYLFYFFLNFLKISEVSNILIDDILVNYYKYLNQKKEIIFEDLLYLLIQSFKNKNENLTKKIYILFENKNIEFFRHLDRDNLILQEDLDDLFFKEQIKKKEDNEEIKEEEKKEQEKSKEEKKEIKIIMKKMKLIKEMD